MMLIQETYLNYYLQLIEYCSTYCSNNSEQFVELKGKILIKVKDNVVRTFAVSNTEKDIENFCENVRNVKGVILN